LQTVALSPSKWSLDITAISTKNRKRGYFLPVWFDHCLGIMVRFTRRQKTLEVFSINNCRRRSNNQ
ncbi:MAG TPA: hypothetical protein PLN28_03180, partial [Anaerolineaceae bacterium]|nr:hypothetical protein [Anaerolineaceae bacterium]